jgi:hypothetical protein
MSDIDRCDGCDKSGTVETRPLGKGVMHDECSACGWKQHRRFPDVASGSDRIKVEPCDC